MAEATTMGDDVGVVGSIEMTSINFIFVVLLPVICLFGLTGNIVVCVAIIRFPHLRTVTNFLLVSLAVADSAVCLIVMPLAAFQEINSGKWLLGKVICDIWVGMDVLMSTASIWNLCAVSIDRYLAVSRPIWYAMKRKPSFAALLISISWVLSIMVSIPALFVGGFGSSDENTCILNVKPLFQIISSAVSFYIPCIFIVLLYIRIAYAAQKLTSSVQPDGTVRSNKSRRRFPDEKTFDITSESLDYSTDRSTGKIRSTVLPSGFQNPLCTVTENEELGLQQRIVGKRSTPNRENASNSSPSKLPSVSGRHSLQHNLANEARATPSYHSVDLNTPTGMAISTINGTTFAPRVRLKGKRIKISVTRERRAAFVIGIVVGVFISCWLPFFVVNVVLGACQTCEVSYAAFQFVTWLGWCNSVLNPVIYTIFNRELRAAFVKVLICKR